MSYLSTVLLNYWNEFIYKVSTLSCGVTWKWRFSPRCDFYFNPIFPARGETDRSSCAGSGPHLLLESIVESNIATLSPPSRCIDHVYTTFSASVFSVSWLPTARLYQTTRANFDYWNATRFLSCITFLLKTLQSQISGIHLTINKHVHMQFVTKDVAYCLVERHSTSFEHNFAARHTHWWMPNRP